MSGALLRAVRFLLPRRTSLCCQPCIHTPLDFSAFPPEVFPKVSSLGQRFPPSPDWMPPGIPPSPRLLSCPTRLLAGAPVGRITGSWVQFPASPPGSPWCLAWQDGPLVVCRPHPWLLSCSAVIPEEFFVLLRCHHGAQSAPTSPYERHNPTSFPHLLYPAGISSYLSCDAPSTGRSFSYSL